MVPRSCLQTPCLMAFLNQSLSILICSVIDQESDRSVGAFVARRAPCSLAVICTPDLLPSKICAKDPLLVRDLSCTYLITCDPVPPWRMRPFSTATARTWKKETQVQSLEVCALLLAKKVCQPELYDIHCTRKVTKPVWTHQCWYNNNCTNVFASFQFCPANLF